MNMRTRRNGNGMDLSYFMRIGEIEIGALDELRSVPPDDKLLYLVRNASKYTVAYERMKFTFTDFYNNLIAIGLTQKFEPCSILGISNATLKANKEKILVLEVQTLPIYKNESIISG